jgi:plastocyanin
MKQLTPHFAKALSYVVLLFASLCLSVHAGDLIGTVKRPPLSEKAEQPVDRYRGRVSGDPSQADHNCACDPGKYAVIWLTGDSLPPLTPVSPVPKIAQKDQMFQPSVLAVSVGSTVEFPNLDPYFHNVFSYSKTKKFDLGRYEQGKSKPVTFDKPGLVKIFCEIHYSMRAYLHVLATPYFAVSDEHGGFSISGVKPGVYTLHVWQENQQDLTKEISVAESGAQVTVE